MNVLARLMTTAVAAIGMCSAAEADPVADFYTGKTITIIVPFNPGGTNGRFAEAIAKIIPQYIPGKPAMKLEYMPGGGGLRGQNFAYNNAPKDGTTLFIPQDSVVVAQLLEPDGVQYDARKFQWLGVAVSSQTVLMVRKDTGATKIDDLKTKEVFIASSGAGSETDMYPRLTNGVLGTIMNVVPGFPGGIGESLVALESGEMQGSANGWQAWKSRPELTATLNPMVVYGAGRVKDIPDVPNLLELVSDPNDQQIVRFVSSIGPIGRGIATTPDVPAERVEALRTASVSYTHLTLPTSDLV